MSISGFVTSNTPCYTITYSWLFLHSCFQTFCLLFHWNLTTWHFGFVLSPRVACNCHAACFKNPGCVGSYSTVWTNWVQNYENRSIKNNQLRQFWSTLHLEACLSISANSTWFVYSCNEKYIFFVLSNMITVSLIKYKVASNVLWIQMTSNNIHGLYICQT